MDFMTLAAAKSYTDKQVQENRHALTDEEKQEIADMIDIPESGGTSDYTELINKPKINGVELNGDLTPEQLGIVMGGGGSEEKWELIIHNTVEENSQVIYHDVDDNGNPFELKKVMVMLKHLPILNDDGTYKTSGLSMHFVNIANLNAVAKVEGFKDNFSANWVWVHTHNILATKAPQASAEGCSLSVLRAENVSGHMIVDSFHTSEHGNPNVKYGNCNLLTSGKYVNYCTTEMSDGVSGPFGVEYLHNANVYNEINKISAFVVGSLDEALGVGSEYCVYGVRK